MTRALQVRTLSAVSMAGYGHAEVDQRYTLLRVLARTLDRADLDLEEGRISPAAARGAVVAGLRRAGRVACDGRTGPRGLSQPRRTPESTTLTRLCG